MEFGGTRSKRDEHSRLRVRLGFPRPQRELFSLTESEGPAEGREGAVLDLPLEGLGDGRPHDEALGELEHVSDPGLGPGLRPDPEQGQRQEDEQGLQQRSIVCLPIDGAHAIFTQGTQVMGTFRRKLKMFHSYIPHSRYETDRART